MIEALEVFVGFQDPISLSATWAGLRPRGEGENTTMCAAAVVPSGNYEYQSPGLARYLAAAKSRDEVAVVICEVGRYAYAQVDAPPEIWTALPAGGGNVRGHPLPLGPRLVLPEDLSAPERDLALRLRNRPEKTPWYGLVREPPPNPLLGEFRPLLASDLGEVAAAVWTSSDQGMFWALLPWGVHWDSVLDWLETQAVPELVPKALARAKRVVDEELLTAKEREARAHLEAFELGIEAKRGKLQEEIDKATKRADEMRHPLLYGTGKVLADAVARVLVEAGLAVESLDETFGSGRSGDFLVTEDGHNWLVEVTSSAGATAEIEVGKLMAHLETWPRLRSEALEGGVLIVNHQLRRSPSERPEGPYRRREFVDSLKVRVVGTIPLCRWWVGKDHAAIVAAITGPPGQAPNR